MGISCTMSPPGSARDGSSIAKTWLRGLGKRPGPSSASCAGRISANFWCALRTLPNVRFTPESRHSRTRLACQLWANSGSHAICANIAQRISADCGWVSRLLAVCFAHLSDIAACFNKTRARLIEVISQHKIEVGVTHRNGHCCPIDIS
jgi:hypothetical protein